jgi:hypothetical protein
MNRDDSLRPSSAVATQTALQGAVVRFGNFMDGERFELGPHEYNVLLDVMCARIAHEYMRVLERQERAA